MAGWSNVLSRNQSVSYVSLKRKKGLKIRMDDILWKLSQQMYMKEYSYEKEMNIDQFIMKWGNIYNELK